MKPDSVDVLAPVLAKYKIAQEANKILYINFTSVVDYMWLLRAACECLAAFDKRAVLYLAAAVSDFYIPSDKMVMFLSHIHHYTHVFCVFRCYVFVRNFYILLFNSNHPSIYLANAQNAIRTWSTNDFSATCAKNVGSIGQSMGTKCICGIVQIRNG